MGFILFSGVNFFFLEKQIWKSTNLISGPGDDFLLLDDLDGDGQIVSLAHAFIHVAKAAASYLLLNSVERMLF